MTKIQWMIYNYLKEKSEKDEWTSQDELVRYLAKNNCFIDKRSLRKNIQMIRQTDVIQKVILTSYSQGYKIMNDESQIEILEKRKIAILKSLKQYWRDIKRLSRDNQTKLTFGSKEREYIEALLKTTEE